jgi:hypothetical protein
MIYGGGNVPGFDSCQFIDCEWLTDSAARRTLDFLEVLAALGQSTRRVEGRRTVARGGGSTVIPFQR